MDPNTNLQEQRRIAKAILADPDAQTHGAVRLAELVEALDEWISRGGFIPATWKGSK